MSGEGLSGLNVPNNDFYNEVAKIKAESIMARREEVIEAFVAKYGFEPERFCLIVEHTPTGTKERVLRLTDEELDKARANLFKTPWQPIETAPKDGTYILGWSEYDAFVIMRWSEKHRWIEDSQGEVDPSHWAPLPERPT